MEVDMVDLVHEYLHTQLDGYGIKPKMECDYSLNFIIGPLRRVEGQRLRQRPYHVTMMFVRTDFDEWDDDLIVLISEDNPYRSVDLTFDPADPAFFYKLDEVIAKLKRGESLDQFVQRLPSLNQGNSR